VAGHQVAGKTDGVADGPHEVRDDLDDGEDGRSANGAEETQKRLRNPAPFLMKPTNVTVMNTPAARIAVTAICDVVVKLIGISPRKFAIRMNRKA
jgi:hypothetical protein